MKQSTKILFLLSMIFAGIFVLLLLTKNSLVATNELIAVFVFTELLLFFIGFYFVKYKSAKEETKHLGESPDYVVCKNCGTKNRRRISYCVKCKSSILIKVCPICKEVNPHDAKYCNKCDSILQNTGEDNMKNILRFIGYLILGIAISLIMYSYYYELDYLFIIGIALILIAILYTVVYQTIDMFKKDKTLDLDKLKESGLTIVKCTSCQKDNVLEDKYCIYCNEKLESEKNEI